MKRTESIHPELIELHKAYNDRALPFQRPTAKSPLHIIEPGSDIHHLVARTEQQLSKGSSVLFLSVEVLGREALEVIGNAMLKRGAMVTVFDRKHLPKGSGFTPVGFSGGMSIRAINPNQT